MNSMNSYVANMNGVPGSNLPSFQSTITIKHLKVNQELSLVSHSQSHEISSLVENLAFIYGPATATYIHYQTPSNFTEMNSFNGSTDVSRNIPSAHQPKKKNRKGFCTTLRLKQNSVVNTGKKQFICDICWRSFTQKSSLKRHKLIHTKKAVADITSSVNDEHICSECGKVFRTKSNLKQHSVVHSKDKPFVCDVCQRGFSRSSSLKKHMITHTKNTDVDSLAFTGTSSFIQDNRTCFEWGKQYSTKANLKRHAVVHSKVNSSPSNTKQKSFSHKTHLKTHERNYTSEKPFQCEICKKVYKQKSSLTKHALVHKELNLGWCV